MNWRVNRIELEQGVVMLDCPGLCWDTFPALAEGLLQEWGVRVCRQGVGRRSSQLAAGI